MLTDILPATARKKVYAIYALIGVALGAVQVAYLNLVGQPQWLTVALAVYGFLGTALGLTAAANTDVAKRDAKGRFAKGEGGFLALDLGCDCPDGQHSFGTALWHRAYRRWYEHRDRGHEFRAAAWGWLADRLCDFA